MAALRIGIDIRLLTRQFTKNESMKLVRLEKHNFVGLCFEYWLLRQACEWRRLVVHSLQGASTINSFVSQMRIIMKLSIISSVVIVGY